MLRAILLAFGVGSLAAAAPVPKAAPAPTPQSSASLLLGTAVVENTPGGAGKLLKFSYPRQTSDSGLKPIILSYELTTVKVTTAAGNELTGEDLVRALASEVPAVRSATAFDAEWRKLFTDDVLFVELLQGGVNPIAPGGAIIRPLPLRPAIRPALPIVPPVGEKPVEKK